MALDRLCAGDHRRHCADLLQTCLPLTLVARKYSDSVRDNFDIYLPEWLARHTKVIYTSLVVLILLITLYQLLIK